MTILVGYTPTDASRAALRKALEIAGHTGEKVVVINAGPGGDHKADYSLDEKTRRELNEILEAHTTVATEFREYARGNTTLEEFKEVAAELNPSMIVIGVRPRSSFGRLVMGSVGDQIVQELDQPVLCVKAGAEQQITSPDATPETQPES